MFDRSVGKRLRDPCQFIPGILQDFRHILHGDLTGRLDHEFRAARLAVIHRE